MAVADVALLADGQVAPSIQRYHQAMAGLAGRDGVRDDSSRYEAIAMTLVEAGDEQIGKLLSTYPPLDSPLLFRDFFKKVYGQYDLRFVYQAPALETVTRRIAWDPGSTALRDSRAAELDQRIDG